MGHGTVSGGSPALRELIREDFATHGRRPLSPGFHALAVHRLGRALQGEESLRARLLRPVFRVARVLVVNLYGVEIPPDVVVGRRLHLPHAHGVVLVPGSVVGDDCLLRHNVTLGLGSVERGGRPTLGDRVHLGPGATVVGAVDVGDDVRIGPAALVVDDVPAGSRVLAPVATVRPPRTEVDLREQAERPARVSAATGPAERAR